MLPGRRPGARLGGRSRPPPAHRGPRRTRVVVGAPPDDRAYAGPGARRCSRSCPRRRGRCSTTSRRVRRGRRRDRPADDHAGRGGSRRPRSCCRAACSCPGVRDSCASRARSRSALRGGRTTRQRIDVPPEVATSERSAELVDRAAAGAAFDVVRRVELLVDHWGAAPPVALRTGAVAVRDLKAPADVVQLDESATALLIEVAAAAGLLATWPDADGNPSWTPTDAFDSWCDLPAAARWRRLATAWLETERLPFLVGTRDEAGKARNALDPELDQPDRARDPRDDSGRSRRAAARARCWPPAPGRRPSSRTSPGSARGALRRGPTRWSRRSTREPCSGSSRSAASRRTPRALVGGDDPTDLLTRAAARRGRRGPDPGRPHRRRARVR